MFVPVLSCAAALALAADPLVARQSPEVASPEDHLGRPIGRDFELADWGEVSGYFRHLGNASSRVSVERVGQTTEGRDFLLATISSAENLARIDELRDISARLADPRGLTSEERASLLDSGKLFVFISCAMHATETAAPQFAMELAHRLATSEDPVFANARDELVVLLAPSLNPDGQDRVVSWYRETVGTPFEATELLELYQYYAGHDNNRDWFGLTQAETRLVTRLLYSDWHPQVYWDVHQQGSARERFFVPPYRDPLNPNLDAGVITGIGALGGRALFDMTREGLTGIATGVTYDMWWNGGNRNVPVRHNIIGILTEAASVNIASPIFLDPDKLRAPRGLEGYAPSNRFPAPWPGGWWRLRDIIDYEHAFARSLFSSLSGGSRIWMENALGAAERALERGATQAPRAWILPSDNVDLMAVERLVGDLLLGGVELFVADEELSADGRTWPAGSVLIPMDQPYGTHVKDLFEVQRYPDGQPPYDVAGWTLPLLFGVHRVAVVGAVEGARSAVADAGSVAERFRARGERVERASGDGASWRWAIARATAGEPTYFGAHAPEEVGAVEPPATARFSETPDGLADAIELRSSPRVGVYAPWSGTMNEGWMRWVFDTFGVEFVRVRNEMILAGDLNAFLDVLVMPNLSPRAIDAGRAKGSVASEYSGGLAPEGAVAIEQFVRAGGSLVAMEGSARWAIELFDLPVRDVTRDEGSEFSCPGSVLRAVPEGHGHTRGLEASLAVFFSRSAAWEIEKPKKSDADSADGGADAPKLEVLLRYAATRTLLSGWIRGEKQIAGKPAWLRALVGSGRVDLFGFRPQYRGWSQDAFELLLRAVFLAD